MAEINCRFFDGYKPCHRHVKCDPTCPERSLVKTRILLIHLEALGAVLRSTALLPAIRRKYPGAHITWVTKTPAHQLLQNLDLVDRILTCSPEDLLILSALEFDVAFVVDKSLMAAGVLRQTRAKEVFGFVAQGAGAIVPATPAARELWEIGLSNQKKFFENKKTENQLVAEALALPYARDPYQVALSSEELEVARKRRAEWAPRGELLIGLNTGCAPSIPHKKLSVEMQRTIVQELSQRENTRVALLGGGPEDQKRNLEIGREMNVIQTPTDRGLRDGLCSMEAMDIVITGDSLGMHMAIALKKWTVAWFGPTCAHEIDFYDRGVAVWTKAPCSPCWKRICDKRPMCYDQVDLTELIEAVDKGIQWYNSSFKQPSSATYSSPARS